MSMEDRTIASSCDALVVSSADGRFGPNRTLAERLAVTNRMAFVVVVPSPTGAPEEVSPEEKLLRAIFGEAVDGMPKYDTPEVGVRLVRGDPVIAGTKSQLHFHEASGEVESVERTTDGLRENEAERITVIVRWPGPLTVADKLMSGDEELGYVEGIVHDGDPAPRLHATTNTGRTLRITRWLPTPAQCIIARGIGAYDRLTNFPTYGGAFRRRQLEWLARSGGRAILSEIAVYVTGDPLFRARVYEQLIKHEPIENGFERVRPKDDEGGGL